MVTDTNDHAARCEAVAWWEALTSDGGEGMVVKPMKPIVRDGKGRLIPPGIRRRGRESLRILYGIDYDAPGTIDALRNRDLRRKRAMAQREFAPRRRGAGERFVQGEPL